MIVYYFLWWVLIWVKYDNTANTDTLFAVDGFDQVPAKPGFDRTMHLM